MSRLLSLPNELLLDIKDAIDDPRDIAALSFTCRTLHYKIGGGELPAEDAKFHRRNAGHIYYDFLDDTYSSLAWAIQKSQDIEIVRRVVRAWKKHYPAVILEPDRKIFTGREYENVKILAIQANRLDILQLLVDEGSPVVNPRSSFSSPFSSDTFMYALRKGLEPTVSWLLENTDVKLDISCLHIAAQSKSAKTLARVLPECLANQSGDVLEDALWGTLMDAAWEDHEDSIQMIDMLIDAGATMDLAGPDCIFDTFEGLFDKMRLKNAIHLCRRQIDVGIPDHVAGHLSLWHYSREVAATDEGLDQIRALHPRYTHLVIELPHGENRNAFPIDGLQAHGRHLLLLHAIQGGQSSLKVVRFLLESGCVPKIAHVFAAIRENSDPLVIGHFVSSGGCIKAEYSPDGELMSTPLAYALDHGCFDIALRLLHFGAPVPFVSLQARVHLLRHYKKTFGSPAFVKGHGLEALVAEANSDKMAFDPSVFAQPQSEFVGNYFEQLMKLFLLTIGPMPDLSDVDRYIKDLDRNLSGRKLPDTN